LFPNSCVVFTRTKKGLAHHILQFNTPITKRFRLAMKSQRGEATPSSNARLDRDAIGKHLGTGDYVRVIEHLRVAQAAAAREGDTALVHLLDTALRICQACQQSRSEAEWHRQAGGKAEGREQELRRQLGAILALIDAPGSGTAAGEPVALPEPAPQTAKRPGLWRRLVGRLTRRVAPPPAPQEPSSATYPPESATLPAASHPTRPPGKPGSPSLVVYTLGPFRVYQNDRLIDEWDSLKARSILKYLLAQGGTPVARDVLMDLFWPDAEPEAARRNLHQAIYALRQTLRRAQPDFQHVQFKDDCYLLNPEISVWSDGEEFEKQAQAGRRLEPEGQIAAAMAAYGVAESLYQGDFLEEELYEDWPRAQRAYLRNHYFDAADRLSKHYVQRGEFPMATALCQKILARDNCREEAHRRLMECYQAQGQRHLAVRQYQICTTALREELDLSPSEETTALYERIAAAPPSP
jgi:DNA-binding SARP family transcriptional activator